MIDSPKIYKIPAWELQQIRSRLLPLLQAARANVDKSPSKVNPIDVEQVKHYLNEIETAINGLPAFNPGNMATKSEKQWQHSMTLTQLVRVIQRMHGESSCAIVLIQVGQNVVRGNTELVHAKTP